MNDPGEILDLSDRDLRGSRFANVRLAKTAFDNVDLSGSTFDDVNASSVTFSNADLHDARFTNVNFGSVEIADSRLSGMRIEGILVSDLIAAYRKSRSSNGLEREV